MKILFACGGTAGHINPALSVAGTLKKQDPSVEILFAGSPRGMEARLGLPPSPSRAFSGS